MKNKTAIILLFILFPLLVGLACTCGLLPIGGKNAEEPQETVVVVPEPIIQEQPPVEEIPPIEAIPPVEEIQPIEPEPENVSSYADLEMFNDTWGINEDEVYVGFLLKNKNDTLILTNVEYTISIQDGTGVEIAQDWNIFPYLFPEQTLGIFYKTSLDEEDPAVENVDISFSFEGSEASDDFVNPFSAEKIKLWEEGTWPIVSGSVINSGDQTYTDIRAGIVCFDAAGQITGGGYTYLDFVQEQNNMGFMSFVDTYGPVDSIEVYPMITFITDEIEYTSEYWNSASILDYNFYSGGSSIYGGAIIQNNRVDTILKDPIVSVVFYNDEGYITSTGSGYIDFLFPGSPLGISPYFFSEPSGTTSTDFTIYLFPGEIEENYEITDNIFVVNSTELSGTYDDKVKVTFTNTYTKQASEVDVYALVYDKDGVIIGGGNTYLNEPTPAGGTGEIEVYVFYDKEYSVASIDAWILPSYWTAFE